MIRGVIESRTCLLPMITPQSQYLIRLHQHYKNGVLPHAGGLLEQPSYFIEAMEILSAHETQLQAEHAEKLRREGMRH